LLIKQAPHSSLKHYEVGGKSDFVDTKQPVYLRCLEIDNSHEVLHESKPRFVNVLHFSRRFLLCGPKRTFNVCITIYMLCYSVHTRCVAKIVEKWG
jgi:hypothetical protein